ncbi:hypothetical protein [Mycolicibacterium brisbanense]|uniref:Conserved domain protein n=1 Tax=Mycolicibacterium brisbanense TaxID=146020 RepID=A0A100W6Y3_9MYCO|nr:hypothetical protein [Mycolicibacterium brisbanense]MCV7158041.1 hypothetical protein [Mycolicibacterium brisbanense]GAS92691.1 conserved domain protein [Mycolicibacterium brisbanense]
MLAALAIVRHFPGQIESDLLDKNLDIADWHQGTRDEHGRLKLSSRRLLEVLEFLKPDTAFKTWAERHGDWSTERKMQQTIANEISRLRSTIQARYGGTPYEPMLWISPSERVEQQTQNEVSLEAEEMLGDRLFGW